MCKFLSVVLVAGLLTARADVTVSDVLVSQRWPWSEKVDVDFLVTGGATEAKVTATWDGQPEPYELGTIGEAKSGWNRLTWNPAASPFADRTLTGFTVSVTPVEPPTNRYLIVDLENGGVTYAARPDGGDGKWSDTYKTTKMAFRRIPAGTYYLGLESNLIAKVNGGPVEAAYATSWKRHDVTFSSDFYVGVFKMTGAQYKLLKVGTIGTDLEPRSLAYDEIRGTAADGVDWPTNGYDVASGSLVSLLRAKAGANLLVDLCQECQWEAAMRAGRTTVWPNGGVAEDSLTALTNIVERIAWRVGAHPVGLKDDNGWGIYDVVGLCPEWTLDKATRGTGNLPKYGLSDATDPIGSKTTSGDCRVIRGGGGAKLFDLLPFRRFRHSSSNTVAGARFCIHLKPLWAGN